MPDPEVLDVSGLGRRRGLDGSRHTQRLDFFGLLEGEWYGLAELSDPREGHRLPQVQARDDQAGRFVRDVLFHHGMEARRTVAGFRGGSHEVPLLGRYGVR